jgi:hypothetical protein
MSASTIIADVTKDFGNFSTDAQAVIAALFSRVTALEGAIAQVGGPLGTALVDVSGVVTSALGVGATVAAAATNPETAAIAIGTAAVSVSNLFVEAFDEVKGFIEGVEGQTPATGATTQETDGAAAGAGVKNLFDAVVDTFKTL